MTAQDLPAVNAALNGLAGFCLLMGGRAIRRREPEAHKRWMLAALASSFAFLTCYVTYHALKHGVVTRYQGQGPDRAVYFFILLSHTPLAAVVVPASLTAVFFAWKGNFAAHVRVTRWLWPVWMYVSLTGVLIYVMLYVL